MHPPLVMCVYRLPLYGAPIQEKVLTPVQQYVRHLVQNELNRHTLKRVLKQLRKLDWDDSNTTTNVLKVLRKTGRTKFSCIHLVASITASLGGYYPHVSVQVVDSVLEDIRYGMETDVPGELSALPAQRRLLDLKFFGELYNYRLFDASLIFEVHSTTQLHYTLQCFAIVHNTPQFSTTLHNPPRFHTTPQLSTALHNTPQHPTTLHKTPQHSTALHYTPQPPQPFTAFYRTLHNTP